MKFVKNAWYAAALSDMVTTKPVREVVMGTPMAVYRTESGQVVALGDRCPHRFVPLSLGMVVGENIECPYHGLQFGTDGMCALNPHGENRIPAKAKVESFPVVERDGIVWMWPGDPALADASTITDLSGFLGGGTMPVVGDSFVVHANVGLVLDNVMDVSHAPFVHRHTFADIDDVKTQVFEMKQDGNTIWANNTIPHAAISQLFAPFWQSPSTHCHTIANMRWDAPFTCQLDVGATECGMAPETGLHIFVVHLLRPIDEHTTRYFWLLARNFAVDSEQVSQIMKQKINHGFTTEDEPAIAACAANMGTTDLLSLKPVLLPGDAAAMRTRFILEQMHRAESLDAAA